MNNNSDWSLETFTQIVEAEKPSLSPTMNNKDTIVTQQSSSSTIQVPMGAVINSGTTSPATHQTTQQTETSTEQTNKTSTNKTNKPFKVVGLS